MVFTGAFRSVVKRAEYCFSSRRGKTNPSVFGGWAVPNPGKTGSGLGRGGTGLACSETGGARSGGKAAGTLRWRCPRRRARQGTQCAPAPRQTNPSYSSVPAFGTMRSPFYSVPVPGAAYVPVKNAPFLMQKRSICCRYSELCRRFIPLRSPGPQRPRWPKRGTGSGSRRCRPRSHTAPGNRSSAGHPAPLPCCRTLLPLRTEEYRR